VTREQQKDGSYSELTRDKNGVFQSLKTHTAKAEGGFLEKTSSGTGTLIHDQRANGDYEEQSLDADGKWNSPAIDVKASVSPQFAQKIKDEISQIPSADRKLVAEKGYKFTVADTLIHADPLLEGTTPHGAPPGATWDNTDGVTDNATRTINVSEKLNGRQSDRFPRTLYHEFGHSFDNASGATGAKDESGTFTNSKEFKDAYMKDFAKLSNEDKSKLAYDTQIDKNTGQPTYAGMREAFADTYAALRGADADSFLERFPNVAELIKKKERYLNPP
jgi:hypothetical protein